MPARRHILDRLDVAVPYQQGLIEIVHRWTNVSRKQIQHLPDLRTGSSFCDCEGQVLFAGGERRKFRMSDNYAGRNTGISGDCFVASIAGDNPGWGELTTRARTSTAGR
jgi:hypothetical protein